MTESEKAQNLIMDIEDELNIIEAAINDILLEGLYIETREECNLSLAVIQIKLNKLNRMAIDLM